MDCARSIELLSEYHVGSLDETESIFVRTHLSTCVDCNGVLEDLKLIVQAAASMRNENGIVYPDEEVLWQRVSVGRIIH